ncbi:arginase family protein, partial [Enterobacter bugandensis]|uniref:arginase family protein n=1 Tax=Enterobacter bugandensis TaxID=881260 RepID=UPI0021D02899
LDPAYAPGTGTPVAGGLSTDTILKLLRSFSDIDIVGFDVVEAAPNYDISEITSLAAATIALDLLYLKASKL